MNPIPRVFLFTHNQQINQLKVDSELLMTLSCPIFQTWRWPKRTTIRLLMKTSAMMNAPPFFQAAAAVHEELSTSPTVMDHGPNQFRYFMLQILTGFLGEPISAIFYKPLKSRLVSQDWRNAIVCPSFKKGIHRMRPFTALWVSLLVYVTNLKKAQKTFILVETQSFYWTNIASFPADHAWPTKQPQLVFVLLCQESLFPCCAFFYGKRQ